MKKFLSNVLLIAICAIFGFGIGYFGFLNFLTEITTLEFIMILVFLVLWFILGIIIHELGHLVCGWMSGYTFGFFKLGSLAWFYEDDKIKFKCSKNFAVGQCLMMPPDEEADFRFLLYNLGGVIFNFLTGFAILPIWYLFPNSYLLRSFSMMGFFVSFLLGITNLIPMRSQGNDGANILEALKSTDGKRALYLLLYIHAQLMKGRRCKEIDEEIICNYGKLDESNYVVGNVLMYEIEYLLELGRAEEALIITEINTNNAPAIHKHLFNLYKLRIYTSFLPDFEKARRIYENKEFKSFLKLKLPSITAILISYEFFVNNNPEKANELLAQAKLNIESIPNKGERLSIIAHLCEIEEKMKNPI